MNNTVQDIKSNTADYSKFQAFVKLTKYSLAGLVVFSAVITYITVAENINYKQILALSIGGFMIVAAANGFNQIIEKDLDKLMDRTKNRPIPTNKLSSTEAFIFCSLFGIIGWWDRAHNIIMQTISDAGILGLMAYLSLFIIL